MQKPQSLDNNRDAKLNAEFNAFPLRSFAFTSALSAVKLAITKCRNCNDPKITPSPYTQSPPQPQSVTL